ncbi:carboxymuconolactone decarboxylase family protein [Nocardia sp. NBC_01327]|uniref:carboxymuconolactone decarboxylase family protein n=1 Tax=Nocardia sp. NBC_01327 TaxID=2903593 RepID=UPI002E0FA658|nr:carboxymuconolactone decarboxylase family protein [Nocardia sp. NBC_01327]
MHPTSDDARQRPDRLPPLADHELTPQQQAAVQRISAGPRGSVFGPFVPLLRSPVAMEHLQELGAYLRFESPLPKALFEMAVLLTAHEREQEFEWNYHLPLARAAGVAETVIVAISGGTTPTGLTADESAAYRVVVESLRANRVSDATYEDAVARLGVQATIDLTVTAGYYSTLAMVMNLAQTPPPKPDPTAAPAGG